MMQRILPAPKSTNHQTHQEKQWCQNSEHKSGVHTYTSGPFMNFVVPPQNLYSNYLGNHVLLHIQHGLMIFNTLINICTQLQYSENGCSVALTLLSFVSGTNTFGKLMQNQHTGKRALSENLVRKI